LENENPLMAICIPTYNHYEPLKKNLDALIPQAKEKNIAIYISDNASTDNTIELLKSYQKIYPHLHFKSNKKNLGVDKNMVLAVRMAHAKYVWAIGSRRILKTGFLNRVYRLLEQESLDLIALNDPNPVFIVPKTGFYNSSKEIFRELNRNLTGLGFQILPLEAWKDEYIVKYEETEWTVFGVALEYLASKKAVKGYFIAEPCFDSSGKSHWLPRCFEIWKKWKKTIKILPSIYDGDKEFVMKKSLNYFFVKPNFDLINMRRQGIYNSQIFGEIHGDLKKYGTLSPGIAYVISKTPIKAIKAYDKLAEKLLLLMSKVMRLVIRPKTRFNVEKNKIKKISYQ
jgi:abequosyltransferase